MRAAPWAALAVAIFVACDGGKEATDDTDAVETDTVETDTVDTPADDADTVDAALFADVQANVFGGCGGMGPRTCHARAPFQGGLDLSEAGAYDALVNVDATTPGAGKLVVPGDVEASFLWRKLTNTLAEDGSEGAPMPLGEAIQWSQLPDQQINAVRAWIEAGAPR